MARGRTGRLELGPLLTAVEDAPPVAAADVLGEALAEAFGATEVAFLISDFTGGTLVRLGQTTTESADLQPLEGTPHGEALARQRVVALPDGDVTRVIAPVTNRGEAIGVVELLLPEPPDEGTLEDLALAGHALAYIVIANRRFTDLYEWGKRSVPLSLAAEIQHRLLPGAYTCEAGQFTLAAWLEPAGDVGGDTFDFSMSRDHLDVAMTDAMGHTVDAAVLATVLVGAVRNARRARRSIAEQAATANAALHEHRGDGAFVTGQLARIDLATGTATIVNAGHPLPLRLRGGSVERIELLADPPFGVLADQPYRTQELLLEPGDRLLFLTDGVFERHSGLIDLDQLVAEAADLHPREAVQHLIGAVLEASGEALEDDATVLCLDWHGGPSRDRTSSSGANV